KRRSAAVCDAPDIDHTAGSRRVAALDPSALLEDPGRFRAAPAETLTSLYQIARREAYRSPGQGPQCRQPGRRDFYAAGLESGLCAGARAKFGDWQARLAGLFFWQLPSLESSV